MQPWTRHSCIETWTRQNCMKTWTRQSCMGTWTRRNRMAHRTRQKLYGAQDTAKLYGAQDMARRTRQKLYGGQDMSNRPDPCSSAGENLGPKDSSLYSIHHCPQYSHPATANLARLVNLAVIYKSLCLPEVLNRHAFL